MAVTVQMQFESAVTEMYQDALVGSSIESGPTIMQFDLRKLDLRGALGTTTPICWRQEPYHVDMHERSTFYNPIKYRFIVAQGYYRVKPSWSWTRAAGRGRVGASPRGAAEESSGSRTYCGSTTDHWHA
jgi:hypothetical protein